MPRARPLEGKLIGMLPAFTGERSRSAPTYSSAGAPEKLARRIALLGIAELVPDMAFVAEHAGADLTAAAQAFFAVTDAFRIGRISDAARSITPSDYYDGLALSRATETISAARRAMAVSALLGFAGESDPVSAWVQAGGDRVARTRERLQALTEGGDLTVSRLTVAAGLMSDLS